VFSMACWVRSATFVLSRCIRPAMDVSGAGSGGGFVLRSRLRAHRVNGDAEFTQTTHVVTDQPLPLALVRRRLIGLAVGNSCRQRPVNDHSKRVRYVERCRPAWEISQHQRLADKERDEILFPVSRQTAGRHREIRIDQEAFVRRPSFRQSVPKHSAPVGLSFGNFIRYS
jgi:hypothetical protein